MNTMPILRELFKEHLKLKLLALRTKRETDSLARVVGRMASMMGAPIGDQVEATNAQLSEQAAMLSGQIEKTEHLLSLLLRSGDSDLDGLIRDVQESGSRE